MSKKNFISEAALKDKPQNKYHLVIKDGAVSTDKLADSAVKTEKIADENVTTEKVKDKAITNDKVADKTLTADKFSEQLNHDTIDAIKELQETKFDKANVVQELGDNEEKVVSQAALPFRYIQSEEFIFAQVDAEDHLLFGIQLDGTPVFGKKSSVEEGLQSQVTLLSERVATIIGDEDTTNVIDSMNELKQFFANIENTQKLTDILLKLDTVYNNLNTTMDKIEKTIIKDEEGNVLQTPFKVIDSPEFLHVVVDAEDHFLFGIQQDGSVEWAKGIPAPIRKKFEDIASSASDDKSELLAKINDNIEYINSISKFNGIDLKQKKISILGDSLSTFKGYIPEGNYVYYPNDSNDVTSVEQTWWNKLIKDTNATLEINNSSSGAKVSGGVANYSYTERCSNLGKPDYIIIHGGTNDIWQKVPAGTLHFDTNEEDLNINEFADAYDLMIRKILNLYAHANIILVIPTAVSEEYTSIIKSIAQHYGLMGVTDLHDYDISITAGHYQVDGMETVKEAVSASIFINKNVEKVMGKSLIDDEIKDRFNIIENEEFLEVKVDAEEKVLEGITSDGKKQINLPTTVPSVTISGVAETTSMESEEFLDLKTDRENHILEGITRDGEKVLPLPIVGNPTINELKREIAGIKESSGFLSEIGIDEETGDIYVVMGESSSEPETIATLASIDEPKETAIFNK